MFLLCCQLLVSCFLFSSLLFSSLLFSFPFLSCFPFSPSFLPFSSLFFFLFSFRFVSFFFSFLSVFSSLPLSSHLFSSFLHFLTALLLSPLFCSISCIRVEERGLVYSLPAVILPGFAVVVSPLLALMSDQIRHLQERRRFCAHFVQC